MNLKNGACYAECRLYCDFGRTKLRFERSANAQKDEAAGYPQNL